MAPPIKCGIQTILPDDPTKVLLGDGTWGSAGGTSAATWGGITGTLSAQTDLGSALSGKVASNDARLSDARTPTTHAHAEADIANLATDLAGKAATAHAHAPSDVTGTAVVTADARLSDARTPTSHGHGPSEITGTAVVTADSRLSDARVPTSHGNAQHSSTFIVAADVHSNANDPAVGEKAALVGTSGTPGSGNKFVTDGDSRNTNARTPAAHSHAPSEVTGTAVVTNDSRLSDARTPTTHNHAGVDINSGSLDGDRLPALSTTKKGGVPATGTPSGKYLKDDGTWAAPAGGSSTPDVSYFRKYGTGTYEAWFTSPRTGTALVGTALVGARFYAMPFICPKAITLDRIGVYVSTLSTGNARLGIYSDNGNIYPGARLLDAGEISVISTGAKILTINQALAAGTLYWLVILCAATPAINCFPVAAVINVLGTSNALGATPNCGLYASQAYGALPATFPAFVSMIAAAPIPAIFVRLSA